MASSASGRSFPVPLVCPSCGAPLAPDAACGCRAATRLEIWNGMPRLLFGQAYRGELSSEQMSLILDRMDAVPWRRALEEAAPDEAVTVRLTSSIGPDFVYGMPWDEIETALDVGSGMGLMTSLLAARAKTVVAVEAVAENALFQRKRSAQDGFPNWRPIIAGAAALPFAPATFDLITLNGAFGSNGLFGEGDPETLQRRFLADALRLLKPGGYLYVGAETRFALRGFSGPGSRAKAGRSHTSTPGQYQKMFARAGFGSVDVFGVFDGCGRQKAVYRMGDDRPRRFARELSNPPASWKGSLLRWFSNVGPWSGFLENEVVIFGRKEFKDGRLAWPGLRCAGPVTQFSTGDKVFVVCFDGEPSSVFKGAKTNEADVLLAKEYDFLRAASVRHGADSEGWPLRWPKPLSIQELHGRRLFQYEFARGSLSSNVLMPMSFTLPRFSRLFARLVESYVELCVKMTTPAPGSESKSWDALLDRLAAVPIGDRSCAERIAAACEKLRVKNWPTSSTHGDLSLSNTMLLPAGGLVLIDWENASSEGLVAIDLMRLLNDAWHESRLLKPESRRAVMERARRIIRDALTAMGVEPQDYEGLEALFVAHQFQMWLSRDASAGTSLRARKLLQGYRDREFALVVSPERETRAPAS